MFLTGMVYNVSAYMDYHPGGEEELMKAAGVDGTELFDQVWKKKVNAVYCIGSKVTVKYFFHVCH